MPKVIVLAHQKGGVGKSTLSINLAHAFKEHVRTAIVDLDIQGSVRDVAALMQGIPVIPYSKNVKRESEVDYVFIDTPPYLTERLPEVFRLADMVLIPTKAGVLDLIACGRTVAMVKGAQLTNKALKACIVLNMVNSSTKLTDEAQDQLIKDYGLKVMDSRIGERSDFVRSVALADGIYSTDNRKAQDEMNALVKEIMFIL